MQSFISNSSSKKRSQLAVAEPILSSKQNHHCCQKTEPSSLQPEPTLTATPPNPSTPLPEALECHSHRHVGSHRLSLQSCSTCPACLAPSSTGRSPAHEADCRHPKRPSRAPSEPFQPRYQGRTGSPSGLLLFTFVYGVQGKKEKTNKETT